MNILAFVPARAGSQTIKRKNMALLGGRPLINHCLTKIAHHTLITDIVVSTDDWGVNDHVTSHFPEMQIHSRPPRFTDGVSYTIRDVVADIISKQDDLPDAVLLVQPTSPFFHKDHITKLVNLLDKNAMANSAHTICKVEHNSHSWNQRFIVGDEVDWIFPRERVEAPRKQSKPAHYIFGNLLLTRTAAIFSKLDLFAMPSRYVEVDRLSSIDIDSPEDLVIADALIQAGVL